MEFRYAYRTSAGMSSLGRFRRKQKVNIEMDLIGIGRYVMVWTGLIWFRMETSGRF
jgi:hypothetical protein